MCRISPWLVGFTFLMLLATSVKVANAADVDAASPSPAAAEKSLQELAANPIGDLITIPFEYNFNFDTGPYRHAQQTLNLLPVIPTPLGGGRTWVSRLIIPGIIAPTLGPGNGPYAAFGDFNAQFFYVPKQDAVMVGYGPSLIAPTATNESAGQGKWSLGPDAVVVISRGNAVYGLLARNVWSVAGNSSRAYVDQAIIQPFSSWALDDGISVSVQSQTTAIWSAPPAYRWTVPLGPTVTKLVEFDKSMQAQIGASLYWNVVRPLYGSTWTASFVFNLLLPS